MSVDNSPSVITEIIEEWAGHAGLVPDARRLCAFNRFAALLAERNRQFNLTSITGERDVAVKHFVDSLEVAARVPELRALTTAQSMNAAALIVVPDSKATMLTASSDTKATLLDIGSGAGFPGIPLKILFGGALDVTLMDSTAKKVAFMNEAIAELGLTGCEAIHARAEEAAGRPDMKGRYDFVTARAVAALPSLLKYCLPYLAQGGLMIAMKGRRETAERELADARGSGAGVSAGRFRAPVSYALETGAERSLIVYKKRR